MAGSELAIDRLAEAIIRKKNPGVVGIDPEWQRIPSCFREGCTSEAEAIARWACSVIDTVADIVPAVKPQMAFFEAFGAEGVRAHQQAVRYAHSRGLIVIDDSKRGDIGNTARAYAQAHLATDGPINADFLTISPFLGSDSMQPFLDAAKRDGKGLFVLVKTSNPGSVEISEARNAQGESISDWLAGFVRESGRDCIGACGYSSVGAVVGATFPQEAAHLRRWMPRSFFLVPGFGAQGGTADDAAACFGDDGLGAVVNSSRGILYHHENTSGFDGTKATYLDIVRAQAQAMQQSLYSALQRRCKSMLY